MKRLTWIVLLVGCQSGPGTCTSIAGNWTIAGDCGDDECTISQSGCSTTFTCRSARGVSGTVSGDDVTWSGETAAHIPGTCRGRRSGNAITGTCMTSASMCAFTATMTTTQMGTDAGTTTTLCGDFAGNWGIEGTCGADTCVITQSGCVTSFSCSGGAHSFTGNVSGQTASWHGEFSESQGDCTATLDASGFTGSCLLDVGATCTITGIRL